MTSVFKLSEICLNPDCLHWHYDHYLCHDLCHAPYCYCEQYVGLPSIRELKLRKKIRGLKNLVFKAFRRLVLRQSTL